MPMGRCSEREERRVVLDSTHGLVRSVRLPAPSAAWMSDTLSWAARVTVLL